MKNYLTMSYLTLTEGLGSQISNFAALYAVSIRTGHRLLFIGDRPGGKGLQLTRPFAGLPIDVVPGASLSAAERIAYTFELDTTAVVDSRVFDLDPAHNFDIRGFFSSYRYWYPARAQVLDAFRFKPELLAPAAALVDSLRAGDRQVVSLHVRRTDYLDSAYHANLSLDYYLSACSRFKGDRYRFLVFSDDIAWCRQAFARRADFAYADLDSAEADLCAMSLCDHNIVANSAFSTWGALLNRSPAKTVVCPGKYLKDDATIRYVNYAWFPDDWVCLDDLLA